ncbi:2-amino-4-oxopentanoate thiolase subunit OrtA [Pseudonocardia acaciae]|uniref:2-amino-4-oxopentanoate thiolase subunit OrtA n=1 Tax=Pseudonocardia acaciae TaxID=551276 RepID=UPI0006887B5E|nr:2-amino-4-oxopentanoate thiolase subunit OrtA [Pseudonocardia acaciae]
MGHDAEVVVPAGTRVQIRYTLLEPGERAAQLPADTRAVPYEVRAKGLLVADTRVGGRARIRTPTGRNLDGVLVAVEPGDDHTFGTPHPVLVRLADDLARRRQERENAR